MSAAAAAHSLLLGLLHTGLDHLLDRPSFSLESTTDELVEGVEALALHLGLLEGSRMPDGRDWVVSDSGEFTLVAAMWLPIGCYERVIIRVGAHRESSVFLDWHVVVEWGQPEDGGPAHWSDRTTQETNQYITDPRALRGVVNDAFIRLGLREFGANNHGAKGIWTHACIMASQACWFIRHEPGEVEAVAAEEIALLEEELLELRNAAPADLRNALEALVEAYHNNREQLLVAVEVVEKLINPAVEAA